MTGTFVAGLNRPATTGRYAASPGFSLLELMITVAIVGILAAIALPSYRQYVLRGNRTDAIRSLAFYQQALERCYSQNFSYTGCAQISPATTPVASTDGYYSINLPAADLSLTGYTLTATTTGTQAADTTCKTFQLTQAGVQTAQDSSSNDQTQTCWGGH